MERLGTRLGTRPDETIQAFFTRDPADPYLCPVHCFTHYLLLTKEKRAVQEGKPNNLFISHIKPHHPITKATLARWILSLIKEAGIDTNIFKAHSLRWLPRVLFSYNRIYRDQTLSARITRGMFVGSYNRILHIQS